MERDQKISIVTGAGTGVGKAASLALADEGWTIVLAGRRKDPIEAVTNEIKSRGGNALAIVTDTSDTKSVKGLFEETERAFGRLDLLFNNAGTNAPGVSLEDLSFEQWTNVVNVNLTGVFLCTQEAFRLMKTQTPMGGRIINNGSISAHVPRPGSAPYTATKHGVTGLTRSTSLDGRKYGIACGQIDIGNALTEMAARMTKGVPQADGSIQVEPVMDVSNVGKTVAHMASLPIDANVQFVTVMATNMPFIGRG
ncbi:MAG: SDR family oxidoreductase [Pseudomonadota bacterium]|jgi:NAD(P)-dependent dehydrogenase (short-subunit alcohol dehydrogenase family)|nr:SDR family oxidoreductase [Pseudomonadota bacterium]MEC8235653.1 SDR family oxidoreductase [Pseudomonadota bacterium]MEE3007651.1 SDR family oxidoreductase [Pseudomonadota bacterium]|tara:strand:+ start:427 stop:1185 length:759 start_codon:yes stop_codon:yes gene_type:complete